MTKTYTLLELADILSADSLSVEVKGDPSCQITALAPIDKAKTGELTFLDNTKYRVFLETTKASAVILSPSEADAVENAIVTKQPYVAYAHIARLFKHDFGFKPGVHVSAVIDETAEVASTAFVGANVVVEAGAKIGEYVQIHSGTVVGQGATVGDNSVLYANVTLYHKVVIGERAIIHSGAVIGADGFAFAPYVEGTWYKIEQFGRVVIEDDVEIGANTCVDRGAMHDTIIRKGVKIDNLVQIAHNAEIGDHTAIAGCAGVAGSAKIGKHCMIGGGAGISGHIEIGDKVTILAMAGVHKSLKEPGMYAAGVECAPVMKHAKNAASFRHLSKLVERVNQLEARLAELNSNGQEERE